MLTVFLNTFRFVALCRAQVTICAVSRVSARVFCEPRERDAASPRTASAASEVGRALKPRAAFRRSIVEVSPYLRHPWNSRFFSDAEPRWPLVTRLAPYLLLEQKLAVSLPLDPLRSLLDHAYPKTWPVHRRNRFAEGVPCLMFFPSFVSLFLFSSHFACCNRETLTVRKLYDQTEKAPSRRSFPEYVIDWVCARRLRTLNESLAKTNLFDFFGSNAVTGNVVNSIVRPEKLVNLHRQILDYQARGPQ